MKRVSIVIGLLLVFVSCNSPKKIALADLNSKRFRYIFDFDSRVAQQKIVELRGNYNSTKVAVALIDGLGNSFNTPQQLDNHTDMPSLIKKTRIFNKTNKTLYADLITEMPIDHEYSCSVKNIQLPAKKSIVILTAIGYQYDLKYGSLKEAKDFQFSFYPEGEGSLKITDKGVNVTTIE